MRTALALVLGLPLGALPPAPARAAGGDVHQFGRRRDLEAVFLAGGGLAGLLAFCLHGFVEFNAHIPANALWFTLLAAVTLKAAAGAAAEGT